MKPINNAWFCHIELTNFCEKACVYCSRWRRHLRPDQYFYMGLDEIEQALEVLMPTKKSAHAWPSRIGIIGGEPTLHPEFVEICDLLRHRAPAAKYGLWTYGGPRFVEYKPLIDKTFAFIALNEHNESQIAVCKHQPATIASGEVIDDPYLWRQLIDNCWVQLNWCPSIARDRAFFCEVAYGIDHLFGLDGGWPVDYNWFMKTPDQFRDQVDKYCHLCGMAVPFTRQLLKDEKEIVTPGLLQMMRDRGLKRTSDRWVTVFDKKLTPDQVQAHRSGWDPRNYRGDICADGTCYRY